MCKVVHTLKFYIALNNCNIPTFPRDLQLTQGTKGYYFGWVSNAIPACPNGLFYLYLCFLDSCLAFSSQNHWNWPMPRWSKNFQPYCSFILEIHSSHFKKHFFFCLSSGDKVREEQHQDPLKYTTYIAISQTNSSWQI